MASPLEISTKKIVNSLLEGEEVDGQIKDLLVTKLVEEKISSLLLLSNVGNDTITKIVDSLPEESKGSVRLYLVSLVDEAKAAQSLKRRKQEQEVEAADLSSFRDNIKKRFGDNVQVPASMVPPYRVLAKLARNPYDYVPVNEFLTSPSGEQTGVQQMQDLNTGKAVSVQISKSRKVTCLSDWVEGFCRWCTALLMIEPDNQNSDPLSMLYYLSRIVSLANRKDVAAAVGFDHCYRSQLLGRHEQGYSISKVLSSDLDPSLFISAEIGTLSVPGKVFQPLGKGNRKDTPCVFYAKGKCSRGDKCPFKHVKTGKSFYDLSEDSGSQKNGERNRKRQRRSRSPSNQVLKNDELKEQSTPVASRLVNELVNSAASAWKQRCKHLRSNLCTGAGLYSPSPWEKPTVSNPELAREVSHIIIDHLKESHFLHVLSLCIERNFPSSMEDTFNSALEDLTSKVLSDFSSLLKVDPRRSSNGSPLRPRILAKLLDLCGQPDEARILLHELDVGCAVGYHRPIPRSKLWPLSKNRPFKDCRRVFDNYRSAIDRDTILQEILRDEVSKGRMTRLPESAKRLNITVTPVALIPKKGCPENPRDQLPKHFRVVEDYKRSKINKGVLTPQTVQLPHLCDAVTLVADFLSTNPTACLFAVDVKSAFRLVGVHVQERYTAAKRRREAVQARRGDDATHITSFLHSALADNTHKTYNSAVSLYKAFLEPEPPFPLKVEDLQCFVYALSQTRMYKYSSIKTYCGSLKAVNLEKGYALGTTSTFAIKRALQASKKLLGDTTEQKRALSRQEVQLIGSLNDFPGCKLELQCLKGATLLATFALLRAREALALRRGDVSFKADRMVVHIARSKNDQSASGHFIFVGCVAGENEASLESCSAATDPRSFRA
ncbi:hypothetical protein FOZ60_016188 [Perkinsus olseni]|uniref:C3H1-type domain-containing protein n=1 Tax=Perkinsus olseni TaxID=32597 RepID=A0A7J6N5G6_PEROL|nr:hypothetical protein FOZ60_016188 [Perkinsus olseni]